MLLSGMYHENIANISRNSILLLFTLNMKPKYFPLADGGRLADCILAKRTISPSKKKINT